MSCRQSLDGSCPELFLGCGETIAQGNLWLAPLGATHEHEVSIVRDKNQTVRAPVACYLFSLGRAQRFVIGWLRFYDATEIARAAFHDPKVRPACAPVLESYHRV